MSTVPEAIDADPHLTPSRSRRCCNVYDSFVAALTARRLRARLPGNADRLVAFQLLMRRVAVISLHTSPLLQPGSGDSGGMNVYVREMVSSLAQAGVECTTYTRADRDGPAAEVLVEPDHQVVFVEAGPHHLPKEALPDIVDEFTDRVLEHLAVDRRLRRRPRQLLAERRGRAPHQARARPAVRLARSTRSPTSRPRAATSSRRGATVSRPR